MITRIISLGVWLLLGFAGSLWAGNTHTMTGDVALEQRAWWADAFGAGYVVGTPAGLCLHSTSANTSAAIAACRAYALNTAAPRRLEYIEELTSRTITYSSGDGTYWLVAHATINALVGGWTRVRGTHYLWQLNATQPTLPNQAVWLLSATVNGGDITAVTDLRTVGSPTSTTFLGLTDTPSSYSGQGGNYLRVNAGATAIEFAALSGFVPLSGGTLTGQLVTDNLGIEFAASDTNPPCSSGNYTIFADLSDNTLKKCIDGVTSDLDVSGAGGSDPTAIHDNVAGEIAAIADKATPVSADHLLLEDSAASNAKKDATVGSLTSVFATDAELSTHAADTTSVHGITDTSLLLDTADIGTVVQGFDADLADLADGSLTGTKVGFADPDANFAATDLQSALAELDDDTTLAPNQANAKVHWSQLGGVPAGFADGTDDGGGGGGADPAAIHGNAAGEIVAIPDKSTPAVGDHLLIEDSAAGNDKKDITIGSLEVALESVLDLADLQGAVSDAQVPDTLTASNYLPLAGGTLTGQLITDNLGIEFAESDTNPSCAAGVYAIFSDLSDNKFKKCENGVLSDLDSGGGADTDAIHDNVAGEIVAITDKATPTVSDHLVIEDAAAGNAKKDITIGSLEPALEGILDLAELQGAVLDAQVPSTLTRDAEWDTEAEVQTAWGSVNILLETEIDASSELLALMDDETGTGALVFGTSPTLATPTLTLQDGNGAAPTTDGQLKYDRTTERLQVGTGAATSSFARTGTLTDTRLCTWDAAGAEIDCNTTSSAGAGDVVGPASAVDNALARYDGTTGKLLQSSGVIVSDTDVLTAPGGFASSASSTEGGTLTLGEDSDVGTDVWVLTVGQTNLPAGTSTCTLDSTGKIPIACTSGALPLAGGTLTGQLITDNLGIEFGESVTYPTCASGNYTIFADSGSGTLQKCEDGVQTDLDTTGSGVSTLDQAFDGGKVIDGANSPANAVRICNGTTASDRCILLYVSGTNVQTIVATDGEGNNPTTWGVQMQAGSPWLLRNSATETCLSIDPTTGAFTPDETGACDPNLVTETTTNTLTNKTLDASATGNSITLSSLGQLEFAGCSGATAFLNWNDAGNAATVPTAACNDTGSIQLPSADFSGSAVNTVERTLRLPSDWASAKGIDVTLTYVSVAASPTGNVEWDLATVCRAPGETWDGTFNTAQTMTDAVAAQNVLNTATQTALTITGCAAGEFLTLRVSRDGTNDTNNDLAKALMLDLTVWRTQ